MKAEVISFSAIYCEFTEIHTGSPEMFLVKIKDQYFGLSKIKLQLPKITPETKDFVTDTGHHNIRNF